MPPSLGGINTAPSKSFWKRLPGAINSAGQMYGGNTFGNTSKITGNLMRNRMQGPKQPDTGGRTTQPPTVNPTPTPTLGNGINIGMPSGMPNLGMVPNNGMMPGMAIPLGGNALGGNGMSGLWDSYNNLSNQIGGPRRQQMYY